jgi:excisionase family DNA binding protein
MTKFKIDRIPKLLTIKEVAIILHSAPITVRRLIHARKINYKKVGSRYLFTEEQIKSYLDSVNVSNRLN